MGHGFSWICPNCGYEFSAQLGFGFRYPWVCHQLIQKARAGAYGAEWQDLVEHIPEPFWMGSSCCFGARTAVASITKHC